jgi:hypothetical protein
MTQDQGPLFDAIDQILRESGPEAVLERLEEILAERGEFRGLLDALLLKARREVGLPLIQDGSLNEIPEPARTQYEDRYINAIRDVGARLLFRGDIAAAWPYFRAISEPQPVAVALEEYRPAEGDERLGTIIEVAFNQGVHPRKGFELILDHYGPCSAITAFESLPADEATRVAAADRLVRHLHEQLRSSLRGEIERLGKPVPPEGASIPAILAGRPWLFEDEAYHIDVSHLGAVVRMSPLLTDPATIALAVELTDYGRNLSPRHRYEGDPPFERTYEDHAVYLRALLGQGVDAAIAHFRSKLPPSEPAGEDDGDRGRDIMPAQVLVRLLVRLGRLESAIDVAAEHLAGLPESALAGPGLPQLCARAGRLDRLATAARDVGDLVHYTAAILSGVRGPQPKRDREQTAVD